MDADAPQSENETGHAAILAEAREYLALSISADGTNRDNALDDLTFVAGEQWSPQDRQQRALTGRPCLTINKLPTFLHQVTNDQRQNKAAIKVHPVGDGADVKKAKVVQGVIRHIEYASNSTVATGTAVNSAATIGFGYFRLVTRYCDEATFDQEIAFKRVRNSFTVYMDPGIQEPDGSDQMRCMLTEKMPRSEFKRLYPSAQAVGDQGLPQGTGDGTLNQWLGTDFVRVAEFYKIEMTPAVLVQTERGPVWEDELEEGDVILTGRDGKPMRRKSAKRRVMWRKLTACDVLEEAEIPCRWIPVFPVFGDEVDLDGKVIRSGLVRHAKDPARMYNYWMTAATEEVALRPKSKYIGAEGQFEGHEDEWAAANVSASPYLEYKPTTHDGVMAPPPARQPLADIPLGVLQMARHASDDVKATTGLFDSSLGARGTATSGVQERAQQLQGDTANFHYADNLQITLRHAGRCIVDMLPKIYDGARVLQIMGEDEKISAQPVNGYDDDAVDLTTGKYDVTIGVGPSYSTARQEATENLIELGANWPELKQFAGDKIIGGMDFHGAEEIAERLKRTVPAAILGPDEQGEDANMVQTPRGPIPAEQAGQMLVEMDQQMQAMAAELQEAKSGIAKAQLDAQSRMQVEQVKSATTIQKAEIDAVAKNDVAELNGLISLLLQKLQPPPQIAADAMKTGKAGSTEKAPA